MKKTHATLRPGTNAILILLWGTLATMLFLKCDPHPLIVTGVGVLLGLAGGVMQTLSFRQAQTSFLDATTMLAVRAKLKATPWGKRYLIFLWSGNALLAILSLRTAANPPLAVLVGFFTLMFVREITTFKITLELDRLQKEMKETTQPSAPQNPHSPSAQGAGGH